MKTIDLTGREFGREKGDGKTYLTVLERDGERNGMPLWRCQCSCGGFKTVRQTALTCGYTRSCGCIPRGRRRVVNPAIDLEDAMRGWRSP